MGELTKLNNAGKMSPGPMYGYTDEIKYQKVLYTYITLINVPKINVTFFI